MKYYNDNGNAAVALILATGVSFKIVSQMATGIFE
jgi:hypothetical protein